jgi:CRP/FNR family transcriptional regulator, cyclic AMP receptor protein
MYETTRLTSEDMAAFTGYAARARWPAGFNVYQRGASADGVFVVLTGRVLLRTRVKSGRGFITAVATSGRTFGGEGLAAAARGGAVYVTDARADEETETLYLSGARFRALVREKAPEAFALFAQVMAEHGALLDKLRELATLSVEQRLVAALVRMARQQMFVDECGDVSLDAGQYRVLCELVGATRESVSLVVNRLVAEGLVMRRNGGIVIAPVSELVARMHSATDGAVPVPPVAPIAREVPVADAEPRERLTV